MKKSFIFLVTTLLCVSFAAQSQKKLSLLPTVGAATPILDNGLGIHLGVNPSLVLNQYVSIEGQLSYTHINATAFISGNDKTSNLVYALVGGRLYLVPKEKVVRPYVNLLLGGSFHNTPEEDNLGVSTGAFLEMKKTVIGVALETPQNVVLKLGRVF